MYYINMTFDILEWCEIRWYTYSFFIRSGSNFLAIKIYNIIDLYQVRIFMGLSFYLWSIIIYKNKIIMFKVFFS